MLHLARLLPGNTVESIWEMDVDTGMDYLLAAAEMASGESTRNEADNGLSWPAVATSRPGRPLTDPRDLVGRIPGFIAR